MTPRLPRIIFAVLLVGTFIAAILPNAEAPDLGDGDKINHIAAFITLSLAAAWAWPRAALWRIALWLSALGGLIEIVQAIPFIARDAEWNDWIADTVAVVISLAIVGLLRRLFTRL
nr:teicoplanin resistance protein VanZ [Polymorphobacter sp.]